MYGWMMTVMVTQTIDWGGGADSEEGEMTHNDSAVNVGTLLLVLHEISIVWCIKYPWCQFK